MKRSSVVVFGILVIAFAPALVWGFFGAGLPGFWPGGMFGGTGNCDPYYGRCSDAFYVGWEATPGFDFSLSSQGIPAGGGQIAIGHRPPLRGVWLGASQEIFVSRNCGLVVSGWYLLPSSGTEVEPFDFGGGGLGSRTWDAKAEWGFVDALATLGCRGGVLLAGFRYDHFSTRFNNPFSFTVRSNPADQADLTANSYMPLVGVQYKYNGATSSLTVRAVGFPVIPGNFSYAETLGSIHRVEATGNYKNSSFLEVFAEYAWKFGMADIAVFGRYNNTHITSDAHFDEIGEPPMPSTWSAGINRNSWTIGGQLGLAFDTPF